MSKEILLNINISILVSKKLKNRAASWDPNLNQANKDERKLSPIHGNK